MRSTSYSTSLRLLPLLPLSLALASALVACGHKKHNQPVSTEPGGKDAAGDDDAGADLDAAGLPQLRGPSYDAAAIIPGMPPPELMGQSCAVDTNKLYTLVETMHQPGPAQLGVDLVNSNFAVAYLDQSPNCFDAVFTAQLSGPSGLGTPKISQSEDPCARIEQVAIAHVGSNWLLATVDTRKDERDVWITPYDGKNALDAQRVTMSVTQKPDLAIAPFGSDAAVVAWVEQDPAGTTTVYARALSSSGAPSADAVAVDMSDTRHFGGLTMSQIGPNFMALGYRRYDDAGHADIVLQVLDAKTAKPDHDAWVLTTDGGNLGSVSVSADEMGGGVIYSIIQGTSEQLWFQQLGPDGRGAPVISGGLTGGAAAPMRVVGPPLNAVDASLAKLPVGFAVAYRALPGGNVQTPRIRVHFLDRFGRVIGESDVALAQQYGGRTAIMAAYDGRIVLVFSSEDDNGKTTLTAVKLPCVGGG